MTQSLEPGEFADSPRLAALLAAAAAPAEAGPQPGEDAVLAAFRELVTEPAGVTSLAARRARLLGSRRMTAVVAATSTVVLLGGGVAAAATGSLPGAAQSTAKTVLGVLGVHVPGPDAHAGTHPRTNPGQPAPSSDPSATSTTPPAPPAAAERAFGVGDSPRAHQAHPANGGTPPGSLRTPGNSGPSRHHGQPTSGTHPTPKHGKPSIRPTVSSRSAGRTHPAPSVRLSARVMHGLR